MLKQLSGIESPNITYVSENFPVVLKKGAGMHLWDTEGQRYLDFTACFGVAALGHRPAIAMSALRAQSAKLIHGMGDVHPTESKIRFLTLLKQMLPYERPNTVLSSTGSEAIETALKTAVLATGKSKFISFSGGYHGLLSAPLRLNNRPLFREGFDNWLGDHATVLPFPTSPDAENQLETELKKGVYAAIVLEPVQGRGGDRCFPPLYIHNAFALAKKYGALVIFDEVFTGFGRTGTLFAFEALGVVPDLLCLGKAMGGGFPLSACVGDILEVWGPSQGEARHTSTFLGHPLSCAVGHATIKEIRAKLPSFQRELAAINQRCEAFSKKTGLRIDGKGFMRGVSFEHKAPGFVFTLTQKLLAQGFMLLPSGERGQVLSLTPPLIAKAEHYQKLFNAIASEPL